MVMNKLWEHIGGCDVCVRTMPDLCKTGARIRDESIRKLASALAPIPREAAKA